MADTTKRRRFSDADILAALKDTRNVRRHAARSLGISESLFGSRLAKMRKAGITVPPSGWHRQKGRQQAGAGSGEAARPVTTSLAPLSSALPCSALRSPLSPRLADILAFNSKLAGHPLVDAVEQQQRQQAERRRIAIHEAWWRTPRRWWTFPPRRRPRPEVFAKRSRSISINSFRGEIERIFSLGVRAIHTSRGEVAEVVNGVKTRRPKGLMPCPDP